MTMLRSFYFLVCLFVLCTSLLAQQDAPYEVLVEHALVEELREDATLKCTLTSQQSSLTPRWLRNGVALADDDKTEITSVNTSFLLKVNEVDYAADLGIYHCAYFNGSDVAVNATVELRAVPYINKFDKSKNLVQGDTLTLRCDAFGFPAPSAEWYRDDTRLLADDERVTLEAHEGVEGGLLKVRDMDYPDAGEYLCSASNLYGQHNATITIRVKDKYAALWPFLGICAEVLVLCIIIFIYEKRRAKKMAQEDAKEGEADHLTNSHAPRDDVRQRKV